MNKTDLYARVLSQTVGEKSADEFDIFFTHFIAQLKKKNETKLLPGILQAYKVLVSQRENSNETIITVRDEQDAKKYTQEIEKYSDFAGSPIKIVKDENIVGGYILKNKSTMVDNSYRKGLVELYATLTQ